MPGGLRKRRASARLAFLPGIEGLRGVAVLLVVLYHCGVPGLSGGYVGVDVFFVISGFLITRMLAADLAESGRIDFLAFYAGRARRLLPSLALVLVVVAALAALILPPVERSRVAGDIAAAGSYVVNWRFAARAVDYSAIGTAVSPVLHTWSLAVEEQFYLAWPALLAVAAWAARRSGRSPRAAVGIALTVVVVASLWWSVVDTRAAAAGAYYSTFTRGWELGAGGLLALAVGTRGFRWLGQRPLVASALGPAAVGLLLWVSVDYGATTPFPGWQAALPVVATVALIAGCHPPPAAPSGAGRRSRTGVVHRVMRSRPLRHVGRVSYVWYLWHWPLLVLAGVLWGHLRVPAKLAVVSIAYLLAVLTHVRVEEVFRRARPLLRRPAVALRLGLTCTVAAAMAAVVLDIGTAQPSTASASQAVGAAVLSSGVPLQQEADALRPAPQNADNDRGAMYDAGCLVGIGTTTSPACTFGDPTSDTTVVLFGDSHADMWFPALQAIAVQRHWRLLGLAKAGCSPADVTVYSAALRRGYTECDAWRRAALQRIAAAKPALVVVASLSNYSVWQAGHRVTGPPALSALVAGYAGTLRRLGATGAKIVVLRDVPHHRGGVVDCVSANPQDLSRCAIPVTEGYDYAPVNVDAARAVTGVRLVDPRPELCPDRTCPGVIGDVLVYRNAGHLTATYAATLAGWLDGRLPPV